VIYAELAAIVFLSKKKKNQINAVGMYVNGLSSIVRIA
jgi:hypothetical protein